MSDSTAAFVFGLLVGLLVGLCGGWLRGYTRRVGLWVATNLKDAQRQHDQNVELTLGRALDDIHGLLNSILEKSGNDPREFERLTRWGRCMLRVSGFFRRRAGLSPRKGLAELVGELDEETSVLNNHGERENE